MEGNNLDIDEKIVSNIFKKIYKDIVKYIPSKILPALIGLVSLPVYTNIFQPDEYGVYSLVISSVGFISSFISGWLSHSALRFYDDYETGRDKYYSTLFGSFIYIYLFVFIIFIFILISPIQIPFDSKDILLFSVFLIGSTSLLKISKKILRGARYAILYSIFSIILPGGKLLLVILLNNYFDSLGILILLFSTLIIELFLLCIFIICVKPKINIFNIDKILLKRIFVFGMPLFLNTTLSWILSVSDRYLIGILSSYKDVGLYSISYNIGSQSLNIVFSSIMMGAYPLIIKAWNDHDKNYVENLISRLIKYFYILCIPITSALFVISPLLLNLLSSKDYYNGYIVLPWVGLGIFSLGLSQYAHKIWELTENTKMITIIQLVAVISNVILNLIFIPHFGFVAAGITTTISYTIDLIISVYFMRDKFKLNLVNKNLFYIIISAILMLVPVKIIYIYMGNSILSFIIIVLSGALFYFILLYLFGVIRKEVLIIKNTI